MRYPVNNPNLMADLNISELRKQLDEIENRALTKDTSRPHKNMHPLDYLPSPKTIVIDSAALAVELVDAVHRAVQETQLPTPLLYLDCEGVDLGRNGSITLMQIYIPAISKIYILDIQTLGAQAFEITGKHTDRNLKSYLESKDDLKVFWDCRSDSDALYAHCGIAIARVMDAQLVKNPTNSKSKSNTRILGLMAAVDKRLNFSYGMSITLNAIKSLGHIAMREGTTHIEESMKRIGNEGSGYRWITIHATSESNRVGKGIAIHPMVERPLHKLTLDYSAQEVLVLPLLLERCQESKFGSGEWAERVFKESDARLQLSRSAEYDSNGGKAAAPNEWPTVMRVDQTRE